MKKVSIFLILCITSINIFADTYCHIRTRDYIENSANLSIDYQIIYTGSFDAHNVWANLEDNTLLEQDKVEVHIFNYIYNDNYIIQLTKVEGENRYTGKLNGKINTLSNRHQTEQYNQRIILLVNDVETTAINYQMSLCPNKY